MPADLIHLNTSDFCDMCDASLSENAKAHPRFDRFLCEYCFAEIVEANKEQKE